jgi:hypothetical protein
MMIVATIVVVVLVGSYFIMNRTPIEDEKIPEDPVITVQGLRIEVDTECVYQ